jgi:Flp pilus assembly protein TadD
LESHQPSLAAWVQSGAQAVAGGVRRLSGPDRGRASAGDGAGGNVAALVLLARLTSALLGTILVALTALLARRHVGWKAALCGAFLLAVNPFAVAQSQRAGAEPLFAVLVAASLLASGRAAETLSRPRVLAAGVAIGLAAATKWSGWLLLLPAAIAFPGRRAGGGNRFEAFAVLLLGALLAFAVAAPNVVLWPGDALDGLRFESFRMRAAPFGAADGEIAIGRYALELLPGAVGWPALACGALGLWVLARGRKRTGLAFVAYAAAHLLALGVWRRAESRYLLAIVPVAMFCVAATVGGPIGMSPRVNRTARVLIAGLVLATGGWSAWGLSRSHRMKSGPDARLEAAAWIATVVPQGAALAIERGGPDIDETKQVVYRIPFHSVVPEAYNHAYHFGWYAGFDYVVVCEAMAARYAANPSLFAPQLRFYMEVARRGKLARAFAGAAGVGDAVAIYRLEEPGGLEARVDSLLEVTPRTAEMAGFLNGLGAAYSRMGRHAVATTLQREALARDPSDARIYTNLGATCLAAGQPDAAIEILKDGVLRFPDEAELRYNLGNAYRARRIYARAIMEYRAAIRLKPGFADAYLNLGRTYADDGEYPEAAAALKGYLDLAPGGPQEAEVREAIKYLRSHQAPMRREGAR